MKGGNVCISMRNKSDLCSDCGMIEALELHGAIDPTVDRIHISNMQKMMHEKTFEREK